jgi:hypothetical protein
LYSFSTIFFNIIFFLFIYSHSCLFFDIILHSVLFIIYSYIPVENIRIQTEYRTVCQCISKIYGQTVHNLNAIPEQERQNRLYIMDSALSLLPFLLLHLHITPIRIHFPHREVSSVYVFQGIYTLFIVYFLQLWGEKAGSLPYNGEMIDSLRGTCTILYPKNINYFSYLARVSVSFVLCKTLLLHIPYILYLIPSYPNSLSRYFPMGKMYP